MYLTILGEGMAWHIICKKTRSFKWGLVEVESNKAGVNPHREGKGTKRDCHTPLLEDSSTASKAFWLGRRILYQ